MEHKSENEIDQNTHPHTNPNTTDARTSLYDQIMVSDFQDNGLNDTAAQPRTSKIGTFFRIVLDVCIAFFVSGLITSSIFKIFVPESVGIGAILLFWPLIILTFLGTIYCFRKLAKYIKNKSHVANLALTIILLILLFVFIAISITSAVRQISRLSKIDYPQLPFVVYSPVSPQYERRLLFIIPAERQRGQYAQTVFHTSYRDTSSKSGISIFNVYEFPLSTRFNPPTDCDSHDAVGDSTVPCELVDNELRPIFYANRGGYDVVYASFGKTIVTVSAGGWGKDKKQIEKMIALLKDMAPDKKYGD